MECDTLADGMESFTPVTVPRPTNVVQTVMVDDPDNAGQQIEVPNPNLAYDTAIFNAEVAAIPKKRDNLRRQCVAAYTEVWESCDPTVQAKLKQLPNYQAFDGAKDVIQLGIEVRGIAYGMQHNQQPLYGVVQLIKKLAVEYQGPNTSDAKYAEQFEGIWDSIVEQGGCLTHSPERVAERALEIVARNGRANNPDADNTAQATTEIDEEIKTMWMLSGANNEAHQPLKNFLENSFTAGQDLYPKTIGDLLSMMQCWRIDKPRSVCRVTVATWTLTKME